MLNFYVVSAGHNMVNDTDGSTTKQFTSSTITKKNTKNEGPFENMGFT